MKIVADNKIPFLKGVFESIAELEYYPGREITRELLLDADVLLTRSRTICNTNLLSGTSVKFIASASIGFDHIDRSFCEKNDITWTNAPGCNSGAVLQYVFSALLYLSKKYNFNLSDRTIGIIGVGNIGKKVAEMAQLFGMKILLNDPPRERLEGPQSFVSIDQIIKEADIITFHVPLNRTGADKTYHMADENFISGMRQGAILINSSRGEIVETRAIKNAIEKLEVKAVLDVWEHEPDIDLELINLVDIATPHIAGYSYDGKANGTAMCVQAISNYFNLGYDSWYPDDIPLPEKSMIEITGLNKFQIIDRIITTSYDVSRDHEKLIKEPQKFEYFRDNYPFRREPKAYRISAERISNEMANILLKLGVRGEWC